MSCCRIPSPIWAAILPVSMPSVMLAGELVKPLLDGTVKLAGGLLAGMDGFKALVEDTFNRFAFDVDLAGGLAGNESSESHRLDDLQDGVIDAYFPQVRHAADKTAPAALGETGRQWHRIGLDRSRDNKLLALSNSSKSFFRYELARTPMAVRCNSGAALFRLLLRRKSAHHRPMVRKGPGATGPFGCCGLRLPEQEQ